MVILYPICPKDDQMNIIQELITIILITTMDPVGAPEACMNVMSRYWRVIVTGIPMNISTPSPAGIRIHLGSLGTESIGFELNLKLITSPASKSKMHEMSGASMTYCQACKGYSVVIYGLSICCLLSMFEFVIQYIHYNNILKSQIGSANGNGFELILDKKSPQLDC